MNKIIIAVVSLLGVAACVTECGDGPPAEVDAALPGADAGRADSTVADHLLADSRVADSHVADSRVADSHVADGHVADGHVADSHLPDSHTSDAGAVDSRAADASDDAAAVDAGACVDPLPTPDRPVGTTCLLCRPLGTEPGNVGGDCQLHADCTAGINGRCSLGQIGAYCSYDMCFSDAQCGDNQVCSCDGAYFSGANECVSANCRVNADCTSGHCAPSYGCLQGGAPEGWFCRTAADECTADADCMNNLNGRCAYSSTLSHWACEYGVCIP